MSVPRDYSAFVSLLAALVPSVDKEALKFDRSIGGYLALRVAADQYLHNGKLAFDINFYRDEKAEGGVSTRLMDEPATDIARSWIVGTYVKMTAERFMTDGVFDRERIRTAMAYDELLRVPHGEIIKLERAALNAIQFMRGTLPSRRPVASGPAQDLDLPTAGMER